MQQQPVLLDPRSHLWKERLVDWTLNQHMQTSIEIPAISDNDIVIAMWLPSLVADPALMRVDNAVVVSMNHSTSRPRT